MSEKKNENCTYILYKKTKQILVRCFREIRYAAADISFQKSFRNVLEQANKEHHMFKCTNRPEFNPLFGLLKKKSHYQNIFLLAGGGVQTILARNMNHSQSGFITVL